VGIADDRLEWLQFPSLAGYSEVDAGDEDRRVNSAKRFASLRASSSSATHGGVLTRLAEGNPSFFINLEPELRVLRPLVVIL
jgi:hypothetical protein